MKWSLNELRQAKETPIEFDTTLHLEAALKKRNFKAGTVVIKVRNNNFDTVTKRKKLKTPSDSHLDFYDVARDLFEATSSFLDDGIRLLGVTVTDFEKKKYQSISLFD